MPLVTDEEYLPAVLTGHPMTEEEFTAFCCENLNLNFEITAEGEIIVMAPAHYLPGVSNSGVNSQLDRWARQDCRGYASDSSTGFVLPNGAQLGWLIDPANRSVEVFRPNGEIVTHTGINKIEGEGPVAGFILDLTYVWDPLAD